MLTRLRVSGFKNLVNVDVRFGPFTCIAGPNGSGKSNLFDAITFLSCLASDTLMNAAIHVRDEHGKSANVRNIFHRAGNDYYRELSFVVEMIIPKQGVDDLGQSAEASITFLKYSLKLRYRSEDPISSPGVLEITQEELTHIKVSEASRHLKFPHSVNRWRNLVVTGRRTAPLISTEDNELGEKVVKLGQDGRHGRPRSFLSKNLPRTVLSTVNATESPTALLARREMQSWRLLQLEPSALREPDAFSTSPGIGSDGSHLPATLFSLAHSVKASAAQDGADSAEKLYDQVAFTLGRLIDDVRSVRIDRDVKRELYTLEVEDKYGTLHLARSLSDGTLRFLALAVLKADPRSAGLICLEEPENGIHPERIAAIIELLQALSVDTRREVDEENPLRQVIINTHSPAVVSQVDDDQLLIASLKETQRNSNKFKAANFLWLSNTWRAEASPNVLPIRPGRLLAYLNPVGSVDSKVAQARRRIVRRRVADRPEFQLMLPFSGEQ